MSWQSAIDPSVPAARYPTTASVRANFATAKAELEANRELADATQARVDALAATVAQLPTALQGPKGDKGDTGADGAPAWLYKSRLTASVSIAATQTKVLSLAIPANTLQVGDIIEIVAHSRYTSTATASTDASFVKIGTADDISGAVIGQLNYGNAATARTNNAEMHYHQIVIRSIGTSGTAMAGMSRQRQVASTAVGGAPNATVTINTTVANYVVLSYNSALAGATSVFEAAQIRLIR